MKIGYQGMEGSNSEEAAMLLAEKCGFNNFVLVPLISSKNVVSALKSGEVDYGVLAIKNSLGGIVLETKDALESGDFEIIEKQSLQIRHCLFVKNKEIDLSQVVEVVSHVQALAQTKENLAKHYPQMKLVEIEDTAIGAKWLASGEISENTAVICRKNAGEMYGLHLVNEEMQDNLDNFTDFHLYKIK